MDRKGLFQITRFSIVGAIGFIVDLGVFSIVLFAIGPYGARIVSFIAAVICTWQLNRNFTFEKKQKTSLREFIAYFASMCVGGAVNIGCFVIALRLIPENWAVGPHIALALGSITGLFVNFALARLVFRSRV